MPIDWDGLVIGPCSDVFGDPVDYWPAVGTPLLGVTLGVFDAGYFEQPTADDDSKASTVQPTYGVRVSLLSKPPVQNDRLKLLATGQWYVVNNVRPDSHGEMRLMLNVSKPPTSAS